MNAKQLKKDLEQAQARASVRLLAEGDVDNFCADVRRARRFARRHGLDPKGIEVTYHGGAVPNSYSHAGEATFLRYADGKATVCRDYAIRRSYGRAEQIVVRVYVGSVKNHPELRKARSATRFHGGYAYLS
jgi:hypothetical protein